MTQANVFFFHPNFAERGPRAGLNLEARIVVPKENRVGPGLLLGSGTPVGTGKNQGVIPRDAEILWADPDDVPKVVEKGRFYQAGVERRPTVSGGSRWVLKSANPGRVLMQTQTGLIGDRSQRDMARAEQMLNGDESHIHGVMPYGGDSTALVSHVRWWRPRKDKLQGSDIPARRIDLWELQAGAELLVVGHVGEASHILRVTKEGELVCQEGPSNVLSDFEKYLASLKRKTQP